MQHLPSTSPPFRRSRLRRTTTPALPLSPTTQIHFAAPRSTPPASRTLSTLPPRSPMPWTWQCHICSRVYPIGATRRCLEDGHRFCAGDAPSSSATRRYGVSVPPGVGRPSRRAPKKTKACASEFDYAAWDAFGDWRSAELRMRGVVGGYGEERRGAMAAVARNCERDCTYPSECRWSGVLAQRDVEEPTNGFGTAGPYNFEAILGLERDGARAGAGGASARSRAGVAELGRIMEEAEEGDVGMTDADEDLPKLWRS